MSIQPSSRRLPLCSAMAATLALVACGGGGGDAAAPSPATPNPPPAVPTYTVAVTVNAVGSGESFQFSLASQAITVTQANTATAFGTALSQGATYTVNQTSGPRTCTLSGNRTGNIAANVVVTAACGTPAAMSAVQGKLRGPIGGQVVLQNNAGDDLALTVAHQPGNTDDYDERTFAFATPQLDGSAYSVTVKTAPAGQTCSVYAAGSGTVPANTPVLVGCETTFDLVSRKTDDSVTGTYFDSRDPVIGGAGIAIGSTTSGYGEGRFTAFVSSAALGGGSAHRQIYWHDSLTGETLLVSADANGAEGNNDSWAPAISADGLVVAFESYASNLVAGDTNGVRDVFVWSATNPAGVTRASVGAGGAEANATSYEPTISGDGRIVAFSSDATNLGAGSVGLSSTNVYRRDLVGGTTTMVSRNTGGVGAGGGRPMLSEDGNRLAFWSFASDIVSGDNNGLWDIFVYDHAAGTRSRVSLTSSGGERNQGTESASRVVAPAISGDGRFVAYATTASNVVPGDNNGLQDVFVVDTQTGAVVRASVATNGTQGNADSPSGQGERLALSYDGSWVAFSSAATNLGFNPGTTGVGNMFMHNNITGETRAVTNQTTSSVGPASMSRSAAYVVFGAGTPLDNRFGSTGLFVRFTGLANSWWWIQ